MKIFLTGGSGFLGYCVAKKLIENGHEVWTLLRDNSKKEKLEKIGAKVVFGNLENFNLSFLEGMEAVYHFAAIRYEWGFSWKEYQKTNIDGTENILKAAVSKGVRRFIYCSTAFVHGYPKKFPANELFAFAPSSLYAKSKLAAEEVVRRYSKEKNLFCVILRPSMVYGPEDANGMFIKLCRLIKQKRFALIGNGKNYVHLTYIDDIANGFLAALNSGRSGEAYILASSKAIRLFELVETLKEELGAKIFPLKIPRAAAKTAGFVFEAVYSFAKRFGIKIFSKEPLVTRSKVDIIAGNQYFDATKAKRELDFAAKINYNKGIPKTIAWYRKNGYL